MNSITTCFSLPKAEICRYVLTHLAKGILWRDCLELQPGLGNIVVVLFLSCTTRQGYLAILVGLGYFL